MSHPYKQYHETKVSRARVGKILKSGDTSTAHEKTKDIYPGIHGGGSSGSASKVPGSKKPGRYARGGKVKGHRTNIAIVVPQKSPPTAPGPQAGAAGPPPMAAPAPPMPLPAGGAGGPPGGLPMPPMHAKGGRVKIAGEATASNIKSWDKRSAANSYKRGGRLPDAGAKSGEGRLEKAALQKAK